MTRRVTINGEPRMLEWDGRAFTLGGHQGTLEYREVEPGVYSVLMDGRSMVVTMTPGGVAYADGREFTVTVEDPRDALANGAGREGSGQMKIAAPMPGRIVRVLVAPGDVVEAGQGLVVVEAMKMQNEMKAPRAGTVAAVKTQEGATVAAGDALVILS